MNSEFQQPVPETQPEDYTVPWKPMDNWIGIALLVLINLILLALVWLGLREQFIQSFGVVFLEDNFCQTRFHIAIGGCSF